MQNSEVHFSIVAVCALFAVAEFARLRLSRIKRVLYLHGGGLGIGQMRTVGFSKWSVLTFYGSILWASRLMGVAVCLAVASAAATDDALDTWWLPFALLACTLTVLAEFTLANVLKWRTAVVDALVMRLARGITTDRATYRFVGDASAFDIVAQEEGARASGQEIDWVLRGFPFFAPKDEWVQVSPSQEGQSGVLAGLSRADLAAAGDMKEKLAFTVWTLALLVAVLALSVFYFAMAIHLSVPTSLREGLPSYCRSLVLVSRQWSQLIPLGAADFWPALSTDMSKHSLINALVLLLFRFASATFLIASLLKILLVWVRLDWKSAVKIVRFHGGYDAVPRPRNSGEPARDPDATTS